MENKKRLWFNNAIRDKYNNYFNLKVCKIYVSLQYFLAFKILEIWLETNILEGFETK